MKKLIILLTLLGAAVVVSAQSEQLPTDNDRQSPAAHYKEFGGFLLDMGLMAVLPRQAPKYDLGLDKLTKDYNQLFSLNPNTYITQGSSNLFSPFYSHSQTLLMGSFKLNNGMRVNTYGEYNAAGYRVRTPGALPWEKNNFKGAFELKSANGAFGLRIEVQQGRNGYPY